MKQSKFQKIICYTMLISAALCFVFALGLSTGLYKLTVVSGCSVLVSTSPFIFYEGLDGKELYYDIQPFNKILVILTIVMIVMAAVLFITRCHDRRKYYISNFVATGLASATYVGVAAYGIINIIIFRSRFLKEVDFETWQYYYEHEATPIKCSQSTFWFDIEIVMLLLAVAVTVAIIYNLIWKIKLMKYENAVLNGSINPEEVQR